MIYPVPTFPGEIESTAKAIELAQMRLTAAREEADGARRAETVALNSFNEAAKAFDDAVSRFRSMAPRDTDWARPKKGFDVQRAPE